MNSKVKILIFFVLGSLLTGQLCLAQKNKYIVATLKKNKDGVTALDIHPNSSKVLIGTGDHKVKLWDWTTDKLDFEFELTREVYSVLWLPNGNFFLANAGPEIKVHKQSGEYHNQFRGHNTAIWSMDSDPDGEYLVSGSFSKDYRIWNIPNMESVSVVKDHNRSVLAVCFNPDGSAIASGSLDETIQVRAFPGGKLLSSIKAHTENIYDLEYHPFQNLLASSSRDETVKIWDLDKSELLHTLKNHSGAVFSISFSPNGHFLLTASADKTIKLWEVATGEMIHTFTGHEGAVSEIEFNPDGTHFVSGSADGTVKLWMFDPELIVKHCCRDIYESELEGLGLFKPQGQDESKAEYKIRLEAEEKQRQDLIYKHYLEYLNKPDK